MTIRANVFDRIISPIKLQRIEHTRRIDPDLHIDAYVERFGVGKSTLRKIFEKMDLRSRSVRKKRKNKSSPKTLSKKKKTL